MKVFRGLGWQIFIPNLAENLTALVNLTSRKKSYICLPKKATGKIDIPAKILKRNINPYLSELTILINNCLKKEVFLDDLKLADITPIFKKENYRLLAYCLILLKVFERIIYKRYKISSHLTYLEKFTMCNTRVQN